MDGKSLREDINGGVGEGGFLLDQLNRILVDDKPA